MVLFDRFGLYRVWRGSSLTHELWVVTGAWLSVGFGLSAIAFLTQTAEHLAVAWAFRWLLLGWGLLILFRLVLRQLRLSGFNHRRVIIVGMGDLGIKVARQLKNTPWTGIDVVGYFDDRSPERLGNIGDVPLLGRLADIEAYVRRHNIHQVWLAFPFSAEDRIQHVLHDLRHCTADIRLVPNIFGFRLLNHSLSEVAGVPVLNLTATPMTGLSRMIKGLKDRLLALIILSLISPLMLAIAIGVKLSSPGPIFYRQERVSWNNRPFHMLKFRSMPIDSEAKTGAV